MNSDDEVAQHGTLQWHKANLGNAEMRKRRKRKIAERRRYPGFGKLKLGDRASSRCVYPDAVTEASGHLICGRHREEFGWGRVRNNASPAQEMSPKNNLGDTGLGSIASFRAKARDWPAGC